MERLLSGRLTSSSRYIPPLEVRDTVPSFEKVQEMSVRELLSVPGVEKLVSIRCVDFYSKLATIESIVELLTALTMVAICVEGGSVSVNGDTPKDVTAAKNALLIFKTAQSIIKKGTRETLFSYIVQPESIFTDAVFAALDYIAGKIMAAETLRERRSVVSTYIDSIDAMMLLLEHLSSAPAGHNRVLSKITIRYAHAPGRHYNPLFHLLDIGYVSSFAISLLVRPPPASDGLTAKLMGLLLGTRLVDCVFEHLLSNELATMLICLKDGDMVHPLVVPNIMSILPPSFSKFCISTYDDEWSDRQIAHAVWQHIVAGSFVCQDAHATVNEDVISHSMELLCHLLASENIAIVDHIIQYLPLAVSILFSPPLLSALSLPRLSLLSTFATVCISVMLRIPRLIVQKSPKCRNLLRYRDSDNPFTAAPLDRMIDLLGEYNRSFSKERGPREEGDIIPESLKSIVLDPELLPQTVVRGFSGKYNSYLRILAHFMHVIMPKIVSLHAKTFYFARITIAMKHLASVFCLLDDIDRTLLLSADNTGPRNSYSEGYSAGLSQDMRYNYRYCGLIPDSGTSMATHAREDMLHNSYLIDGRIVFPSPLNIFAVMFQHMPDQTSPLLSLHLMLFTIKTGQQTIIKHHVVRILTAIIALVADSSSLFSRVLSDMKITVFLPSVAKKNNRNSFCNLLCEIVLRTCLSFSDARWRLYREYLSRFYDTDDIGLHTTYPLAIDGDQLLNVADDRRMALLVPLLSSPEFLSFVKRVLEADHDRYVAIRNKEQVPVEEG